MLLGASTNEVRQRAFLKSVTKDIAEAAEHNDVYMQLCMAQPNDMMLALHAPRVTELRVSKDFSTCASSWDIGASSLLAWSLGFLPSKDMFWTTARQPGNPYASNPKYEFQCRGKTGEYAHTHPVLDALIATHSGGPVGIGDGKSDTYAATAAGCAMKNGTLLPAAKPWTIMDRAFESDAVASCGRVCALWQTNAAAESYSVIAINITTTLKLDPWRDLWPAPPTMQQYAVWSWHGADTRCTNGTTLFGDGIEKYPCAMLLTSHGNTSFDVAAGAANNGIPGMPFALVRA